MSAYPSITDLRRHSARWAVDETADETEVRTVGQHRRQRDRDARRLLELVDVRNSWQHRTALASLVGIDVTLGISENALRRAVRKVGVEAIEREIEDVRYGTFAVRSQRPRPQAVVRRGRRPG
jgi:hypothetical protein